MSSYESDSFLCDSEWKLQTATCSRNLMMGFSIQQTRVFPEQSSALFGNSRLCSEPIAGQRSFTMGTEARAAGTKRGKRSKKVMKQNRLKKVSVGPLERPEPPQPRVSANSALLTGRKVLRLRPPVRSFPINLYGSSIKELLQNRADTEPNERYRIPTRLRLEQEHRQPESPLSRKFWCPFTIKQRAAVEADGGEKS